MSAPLVVKIQQEDFKLQNEIDSLTDGLSDVGAIVSFTGKCRGENGSLNALELEHYPGMAERQIEEYAKQAIERFDLKAISVIHRYGKIVPGENIVLVIAASPHRQASFDGANFMMDFLKTNAPFWKKEHLVSGEEGKWVEAKDEDNRSLDKWQNT